MTSHSQREAASAGTVQVKYGKSSCTITLRKKAPDKLVTSIARSSNEVLSSMKQFGGVLVGHLQQKGVSIKGSKGGTESEMEIVCGRFGVLIQANAQITYDLGSLSSRDPALSKITAAAAKQLGLSLKGK
jgi:hypothetical protein